MQPDLQAQKPISSSTQQLGFPASMITLVEDTFESSKWIFVLSTSRSLCVRQKKKAVIQHTSFLAGDITTAAGELIAHNGVPEVHNR